MFTKCVKSPKCGKDYKLSKVVNLCFILIPLAANWSDLHDLNGEQSGSVPKSPNLLNALIHQPFGPGNWYKPADTACPASDRRIYAGSAYSGSR